MSKKSDQYKTPGGIEKWREQCGFNSWVEAAVILGIGWRQIYRWRISGLPKGLHGTLIAERMHEIEHGLKQKKKVGK